MEIITKVIAVHVVRVEREGGPDYCPSFFIEMFFFALSATLLIH
jgi:hypothetical protein